jgi:hypothetical protein
MCVCDEVMWGAEDIKGQLTLGPQGKGGELSLSPLASCEESQSSPEKGKW